MHRVLLLPLVVAAPFFTWGCDDPSADVGTTGTSANAGTSSSSGSGGDGGTTQAGGGGAVSSAGGALAGASAAGGTTVANGGTSPGGAPPTNAGGQINFNAPDIDSGDTVPCEADGGACECPVFEFAIETRQSCALDINPDAADPGVLPLDAESFIEIEDTPFRVFAMNRWGEGHIVAWCDGTTVDELGKQFPLLEYLGQKDQPRVASFGYQLFCGDVSDYNGEDYGFSAERVDYLGASLPIAYLDDPESLREDYDAIIVCGNGVVWDTDFSETMQRYVSELGGGVLLVGEYVGSGISSDELAGLTQYGLGSGIEFVPVSLDWAPSATSVDLDCVADVPPPIIR